MTFANLYDRISRKLENLPQIRLYLYVLVAFLLVMLINGVSLFPMQPYQRVAENPFMTRNDIFEGNFWQETVLLPVFAFLARLNSPLMFTILCGVIILASYLLFSRFVYLRWGAPISLLFSIILVSSPLTTILLVWIGTPDGLTFLLTIPFLFITSPVAIFFLAALGTTNHITLPIAAFGILLLRFFAKEDITIKQVIAGVLGGVLGFGIVKLFLFVNDITVVSRFDIVLSRGIKAWAEMHSYNLPMSLFSLFNLHWFLLLACFVLFFRADRRYFLVVVGVLLGNGFVTFLSEDTTRIFSLLSWGVLMHSLIHSYRLSVAKGSEDEHEFLRLVAFFAALSLLSPRFYSWQILVLPSTFNLY